MPASDLEFTGSYAARFFNVTFMVDGQVIRTSQVAFGAAIVVPECPEKEGYTFSGWGGVPVTMPAEDIVLNASYIVNSYKLSLYIDGELYGEEMLEYGAEIVLKDPEVAEGREFEGWKDVPETMPAHDLAVYGTTSEVNSVAGVSFDDDTLVNVFTVNGVLVLRNVRAAEALERLEPGIYIINGKKMVIR